MSYQFCPHCAAPLQISQQAGRERAHCATGHFTHWDNPLPVVAALVQVGNQMLTARNAAWPPNTFALITGFLERDETPEQGIAREVKEETNLDAQEIKLIGVYEFMRKNELIIAYHVRAEGEIILSEELAEYKLQAPHELRPWRRGTGFAVADWMRAQGLEPVFIERPPLPLPQDLLIQNS